MNEIVFIDNARGVKENNYQTCEERIEQNTSEINLNNYNTYYGQPEPIEERESGYLSERTGNIPDERYV